jgi:hypothetical protein
MDILLAILIGGSFGFVLERVGAANPQRIIGMLRLNDTHLIKVILGAIAFSSILLFIGLSIGMVDVGHISIKSSHLGVIFGGLLFGAGFAIAGYCPGTGLCALGVGRRDAIWFIVGGLLGALLFTLLYDVIKDAGLLANLGGKVSLAVTGSKYESLVDSGLPFAFGIAMVFGAITWFLPERILK